MLKKRFFKTMDECEVSFYFEQEDAETVDLVLESENWEPIEMERLKSGPFKTSVRLPLDSQIQYKYRVNGEQWVNDDQADTYAPNEYGEENSVVDTSRLPD